MGLTSNRAMTTPLSGERSPRTGGRGHSIAPMVRCTLEPGFLSVRDRTLRAVGVTGPDSIGPSVSTAAGCEAYASALSLRTLISTLRGIGECSTWPSRVRGKNAESSSRLREHKVGPHRRPREGDRRKCRTFDHSSGRGRVAESPQVQSARTRAARSTRGRVSCGSATPVAWSRDTVGHEHDSKHFVTAFGMNRLREA
jgi:hypothetical protein